ncbi:MAG: TolB family protein [Deltaproteobacteria bacterium]
MTHNDTGGRSMHDSTTATPRTPAPLVLAVLVTLAVVLALPAAAGAARIAFVKSMTQSSPPHVWTIQPDGAGLKRLTSGAFYEFGPAWSPGRGTIAFIRSRTWSPFDRQSWVMLMRSGGANQRRLGYTGPSLATGTHVLAYSPNGRHLAGGTVLKPAGGSWGQLWGITLLNLRTHRSRIIYRYPSENGLVALTWSPDGSQLVATVEYGGGYGMFRLAVPSGKLLKSYRLNASSASWHPRARRLLCSTWVPAAPGAPFRTQLRRLDGTLIATLGQDQLHPVYSPDGAEYAFLASNADGTAWSLRRADGAGNDVRTIYAPAAGQSLGWPAWR